MAFLRRRPFDELFWAKVDRSGGPEACWPFLGYRLPRGYGMQAIGYKLDGTQRRTTAHRVAWELVNGPAPADADICHSCDNPPCCNPAHLAPGTRLDNMRDASRKGRTVAGGYWRTTDHCKRGHALVGDNVAMKHGKRNGCRACSREQTRAWQLARRHLHS